MGQVLLQDKITQLTESSGTITLAAGARLTIGGQQYTTSSALNVAANVSSPNARYQIFAVLNSGVVELVVSSNENSVGPAGATAWKLVGSYYSNGLSPIGFGSFVNIEGVPKTGSIEYIPSCTLNTNISSGPNGYWERDGKFIHIRNHLVLSGTPNNVQVEWGVPSNLGNFDTSIQFESQFDNHGYCHVFDNSGSLDLSGGVENAGPTEVTVRKTQDSNSLFGNDLAASDRMALNYRRPMEDFSVIQIKDL
jgi:hypothetical protein